MTFLDTILFIAILHKFKLTTFKEYFTYMYPLCEGWKGWKKDWEAMAEHTRQHSGAKKCLNLKEKIMKNIYFFLLDLVKDVSTY